MLGNHVRRHLWVCCTNCCTDASLNPLKCTKTDASHLYFTTTYARLGLFVIGRSWVQLPLSAPISLLFLERCVAQLTRPSSDVARTLHKSNFSLRVSIALTCNSVTLLLQPVV